MQSYQFFVPCALGLEELLAQEMQSLGAQAIKPTNSGVTCTGDIELGYRLCLWSRLGSRVLLKLVSAEVHDRFALEKLSSDFPWHEVFNERNTFAVRFNGTSQTLRNTQFSAQVVKDGIVDAFRRTGDKRPTVDAKQADISIQGYLHKGEVTLYLDLAGAGLHERGYRQAKGAAPIRETLAAALVMRAGLQGTASEAPEYWPELIADPTCGSGTLLIEAALMATDRAPGLGRTRWGFNAWRAHRADLWNRLKDEAQSRFEQGLAACHTRFHGVDLDPQVVEAAEGNIAGLGLSEIIKIETGEFNAPWLMKRYRGARSGLILSNPPYGERLGSPFGAWQFYRKLGTWLQPGIPNWKAAILAPDETMIRAMRVRTDKKYKLNNGGIPVLLAIINMHEPQVQFERPELESLANRLQKNWKHREKWAANEGVNCFRVYDADIPEFNAAIDYYDGALVIQEYAAPSTIPEQVAEKRWWQVIEAALDGLPVDPARVYTRQRKRQKGEQQYGRVSEESVVVEVQEYNARFFVNLTDYLDTGIFLDHRWVRKSIQSLSKDKRVLNLFAYTGTASVHAALGGASEVTTIDLSKTYLNWAKDNFRLNHLTISRHPFVHADCMQWLATESAKANPEQWDLIFIDPPTFSNSKRMDNVFDVQRDHSLFLEQAKKLLAPDGLIIFTNNRRGFKLDLEAVAAMGLQAEDNTRASIPPDFEKQRAVHVCWYLRHA
ncbi:bifunctional 23S rRNA (guanine(2069)-N(7))-methyltransferase RlmK/23S rRNA (guanine(2445)-N(2))-methyltransferase RlmL [Aliidiomarina halalkaliphila]|uniref:Ribosomal RNA large subunit methyltransferase K/L n=1 Tax=Aliidiomarina halalkaliphila TaxID=2593535 RepID=A0A552X3X3_9GAMM|nr:bifunctional 23S rRNA (guanine(2069)-N(7))-methyltransferase RlmK/23S rRNA (guanine(2445)-N(2))-methyltransferase RlmL [Aliidiomarina halalkaliphila]TRW49734.1 bifunctional 23S rRNA (guanine(2069)-N(7))-methyltransferase RlmK/23S rRNA (guanine(2445)-N(2))-methyltransferase RlmL [Aliidiomarina halalkaliphila]